MPVFYSLFLAHTLADFVFQTEKQSKLKAALKPKGFLVHFLVVALLTFSLGYGLNPIYLSIIVVGHLIIDLLKAILLRLKGLSKNPYARFLGFALDQLLHIALILGVVIYSTQHAMGTLGMGTLAIAPLGLFLPTITQILYIALSGRFVVPLALDIFYAEVPNYNQHLNKLLKDLHRDEDLALHQMPKTGMWIGILERSLMAMFLFMGRLDAIGVIVAIKSLARFKLTEHKVFAEYYLLGTFTSILYTFTVFYGLRALNLL